jgi:hypothetical protein
MVPTQTDTQRILLRFMCDYRRGMDCWMDLLTTYKPLGTTSNYAIADFHTSQITTASAKPFSILQCFHQPFPGNDF